MKNKYCCYFSIILFSFILLSCEKSSGLKIGELKCENLVNPDAIDNTTPHFSWKIIYDGENMQQQFYEIQVASDSIALSSGNADLWDSGKSESSESVMVPYSGKFLSSRSLCYWRVRVWNQNGEVSPWSDIARFGVGILDKDEWKGKYIGLSEDKENFRYPLLRKKFEIEDSNNVLFLHVNSLGYHEIYINGEKVGDDVLSPAVSQLNKRSLSVTYDLTSSAKRGSNEILVYLGRGWFRESLFDTGYAGPLVKLQLDSRQTTGEWETILVSDNSWEGRNSGYGETGTGIWYPHQFGGEIVDAREVLFDPASANLDKLDWYPVIEVKIPEHGVSPQMCEPNRITEIIKPAEIKQVSDNVWVVDMGKALTGWMEINFPQLQPGHEITIQYSDCLDDKGNFRNQEDNGQYHDKYIAGGKEKEVFKNKFNYHSFRYMEISNLPEAPKDIRAYLIHTNYSDISSFECSDSDLNAIHDMIKYTFRCLSPGGYVVDCAHLERMGYGGDGNASSKSFQTMYAASPLYANWMQMWKDCIREDGGMPHAVPNYYPAGGGPYWCGFIITGSWQTYLNYGDMRLIEKYYPVMQHWLEYVDEYTVDGLLKRWPDTDYRGWYLGDWLAPAGVDFMAQNSIDLVNNCFISDCFATMEKIATTLEKTRDADLYKERKEKLNKLIQETFYDKDTKQYSTGSQIDMSYPMLVGVTADSLIPDVSEQLINETMQNRDGHFGVGLVGITILTDWAIKNRQADFLYSMLKKRDYPGYLYMLDTGATATWESWSGERSRIHNCYNGIGTWFYQAIGGIIPDENKPGYRHVIIRPQIPTGITWAKTAQETPYGTVSVNWELQEDKMIFDILIPPNSSADFISPFNASKCIINEKKMELTADSIRLNSGKYKLIISLPKFIIGKTE